MSRRTTNEEDAALVAGVRAGDEAAFVALTEPYRRQLHLHCYRMLGSFDDAEDLVQETLLRAWKGRAGFEGRAMVRTWLYRIATNACLDLIESKSRRLQSIESPQAADSYTVDWLQPYPDRLLDQIASSDSGPDALVIERETIELAYLAAIQHLPPRQRAILILRDALGWSAKETARLLEESVASVNSALHRARSSMRQRLSRAQAGLVDLGDADHRRDDVARALHGCHRSGGRRCVDSSLARGGAPHDAAVPNLVQRARRHRDGLRILDRPKLAQLSGSAPDRGDRRQPATGGGGLRSAPWRLQVSGARDRRPSVGG